MIACRSDDTPRLHPVTMAAPQVYAKMACTAWKPSGSSICNDTHGVHAHYVSCKVWEQIIACAELSGFLWKMPAWSAEAGVTLPFAVFQAVALLHHSTDGVAGAKFMNLLA